MWTTTQRSEAATRLSAPIIWRFAAANRSGPLVVRLQQPGALRQFLSARANRPLRTIGARAALEPRGGLSVGMVLSSILTKQQPIATPEVQGELHQDCLSCACRMALMGPESICKGCTERRVHNFAARCARDRVLGYSVDETRMQVVDRLGYIPHIAWHIMARKGWVFGLFLWRRWKIALGTGYTRQLASERSA